VRVCGLFVCVMMMMSEWVDLFMRECVDCV